MEVHFHLKNALPGNEGQGYNLWFASHPFNRVKSKNIPGITVSVPLYLEKFPPPPPFLHPIAQSFQAGIFPEPEHGFD